MQQQCAEGETHFNLNSFLIILYVFFLYLFIFLPASSSPSDITNQKQRLAAATKQRMNTNRF